MTLLDEGGERTSVASPHRRWWLLASIAVVVAGGIVMLLPRSPRAPDRPVAHEQVRSAPAGSTEQKDAPATAAPDVASTPAALPREARRTRTPRAAATSPTLAPAAVPAAPAFSLRIETDVPGASVFVDRKYLGTSPLTTTDVTPGTHRLNVSKEGHGGTAQSIDVAETGVTTVVVRLTEVQLDAAVDVVHKHAMGSCEGRLRATPTAVRYETSHSGDAFSVALGDLERLEVDYAAKTLRMKQRGGRTWNFTTHAPTADDLFRFHRDVDQVRRKLSGS